MHLRLPNMLGDNGRNAVAYDSDSRRAAIVLVHRQPDLGRGDGGRRREPPQRRLGIGAEPGQHRHAAALRGRPELRLMVVGAQHHSVIGGGGG